MLSKTGRTGLTQAWYSTYSMPPSPVQEKVRSSPYILIPHFQSWKNCILCDILHPATAVSHLRSNKSKTRRKSRGILLFTSASAVVSTSQTSSKQRAIWGLEAALYLGLRLNFAPPSELRSKLELAPNLSIPHFESFGHDFARGHSTLITAGYCVHLGGE